ncbi:two-component sensor histidine kinase [Gordonia sp. SID5947]|uniref:sensor histidine kinase n=1 Tax=Gordonia sp. SID5947 TaxID=2690315 RepID=UPI00136BEE0C|nr:histidine kinase [Gordonia sp. SID5947]MYR07925.1 two-component sensor histidine kinase [Gordonia sp. SID5947]
MNTIGTVSRSRNLLLDLLVLTTAFADIGVALLADDIPISALTVGCAVGAITGVVARRRHPVAAFLLTLPALAVLGVVAAPAVTVYSVARRTTRATIVAGCVVASAVTASVAMSLPEPHRAGAIVIGLAYFTAGAAAPALLGRLTRVHHALRIRLDEIEAAHEHERDLYAQNVLATERAQIGREMHDVVSHQVTLIAVRAATILVDPNPERARGEAATIRRLAISTLDELRHLVTLLRASGGTGEDRTTAPLPAISDIRMLVDSSGIDVLMQGDLPSELPGAWQRTIYRTIQESLTNARKHAPGSKATITYRVSDRSGLSVTVANTPPTRPALPLPGAGHGLIGLRERAEILGGSLEAHRLPDGGFSVSLTLPTTGEGR